MIQKLKSILNRGTKQNRTKKNLLISMLIYIFVFFILLFGTWVWVNSQPPENFPVLNFERTLHISHRGGASIGPENTLPTFRRAVDEFRTDVLEMDVHASMDGIIVVHHDEDVSRTTNGTGLVKEMTFKDLRKLDAGYRFTLDDGRTFPFRDKAYTIPTLEEVFDSFPDLYFHIDIKQITPPIEDKVLSLIRKKSIQNQVFIGSTFDSVSRRIRLAANEIATFPARKELVKLYIYYRLGLLWLYHFKDEEVAIVPALENGQTIVTPRFVRAIHRRGRKLFVFVIDDAKEQLKLIKMGVDGIMTDRPDTLRETLIDWEGKQ